MVKMAEDVHPNDATALQRAAAKEHTARLRRLGVTPSTERRAKAKKPARKSASATAVEIWTLPRWYTRLSHLSIIEHKGSPPHEVRPTAEQLFCLIDLAVQAGGIEALRAWLDDVEQLIKRKRGKREKYEHTDFVLILEAYKAFRLASPPPLSKNKASKNEASKHKALKRKAITQTVDKYWEENKQFLGESKKSSVIARLMKRPWPPKVGAGSPSPLQRASKLSD